MDHDSEERQQYVYYNVQCAECIIQKLTDKITNISLAQLESYANNHISPITQNFCLTCK